MLVNTLTNEPHCKALPQYYIQFDLFVIYFKMSFTPVVTKLNF